jgi:hypothetical protein
MSSGSRVVPFGEADGKTDGGTDMTKLIVTCNFTNTPEKEMQM